MDKKFTFNWDKIANTIKEQEEKTSHKKTIDIRFFKPKRKEDGTGDYVIRFLPSIDTDLPIITKYFHNFEIGKKYFMHDCPVTIGEKCPIDDYASEQWNSGTDKDTQDYAKKFWKKNTYISNILIVRDEQHQENEGKVFLWEFGKQIFDKIEAQKAKIIKRGGSAVDAVKKIFDYYEGTNFGVTIKTKTIPSWNGAGNVDVPNYEDSAFEDSAVIGNDEFIEKIHNALYKLSEFVDVKKFKSYAELKMELDKFLIKIGRIKDTNEAKSGLNEALKESNDKAMKVLTVETPIVDNKPETSIEVPDLNIIDDDDEFIRSLGN